MLGFSRFIFFYRNSSSFLPQFNLLGLASLPMVLSALHSLVGQKSTDWLSGSGAFVVNGLVSDGINFPFLLQTASRPYMVYWHRGRKRDLMWDNNHDTAPCRVSGTEMCVLGLFQKVKQYSRC